MIDTLIDITLLAFLAITAIAINRIRNLFAVIMLFGIFSLLSAGLFVVLDAADVAFTEAAVGAGISTVLMLATLALTKDHEEKVPAHRPWLPLVVVFVTAAALMSTVAAPPCHATGNVRRDHEAGSLGQNVRTSACNAVRMPAKPNTAICQTAAAFAMWMPSAAPRRSTSRSSPLPISQNRHASSVSPSRQATMPCTPADRDESCVVYGR